MKHNDGGLWSHSECVHRTKNVCPRSSPPATADMLAHGFEWTMENGHPLNSPRYRMPHQPACCGLTVVNRMTSCDKCWQVR